MRNGFFLQGYFCRFADKIDGLAVFTCSDFFNSNHIFQKLLKILFFGSAFGYTFRMTDNKNLQQLKEVKDEYIAQWGILGSNWGVNRTMAQIHGLLMVTDEALSTDDIMEELEISRGNAHSNIKELVNWQLIRSVLKKGDRKEYFEAEKDSMKVFAHVARERQRREIDPVIVFLEKLLEDSKDIKGAEAKAFRSQIKDLKEFTSMGAKIMSKFAKMGHGRLLKWGAKFLK